MSQYLSVYQLNHYLQMKMEKDPYLRKIYVTGQVSGFKGKSGHQYFSLKDDSKTEHEAVINAIIWRDVYQQLAFKLEEGLKVNVVGSISLYSRRGSYSLVIDEISPDGIGALALRFKQLQEKLGKEGLFLASHKKVIKNVNPTIGIITSKDGAAIGDIISTIDGRFRGTRLLIFPCKVQGKGSDVEVATCIRQANERGAIDLLIVGRGGGSVEDLWTFNEESVVRAIYGSQIPIISSVGHEQDVTLSDYAADLRGATPTKAATQATPWTKDDLLQRLSHINKRLTQAMMGYLKTYHIQLDRLLASPVLCDPKRLYQRQEEQLQHILEALEVRYEQFIAAKMQQYQLIQQRLLAKNPIEMVNHARFRLEQGKTDLKRQMANYLSQTSRAVESLSQALMTFDVQRILNNGFALIYDKAGQQIRRTADIEINQELAIQMTDGQVEVEVTHVP